MHFSTNKPDDNIINKSYYIVLIVLKTFYFVFVYEKNTFLKCIFYVKKHIFCIYNNNNNNNTNIYKSIFYKKEKSVNILQI